MSDIEIRKLSPGAAFGLSQILDCGNGWKCLMAIIPEEGGVRPKYSFEHVKMIECAGEKQKRACADILLEEWGTSGRRRPHLSDLLDLLTKAQLYRAADYVATELLKVPLPLRPSSGPAANVSVPNLDSIVLPSSPLKNVIVKHNEPSAPPMSDIIDASSTLDQPIHTAETLQVGLSQPMISNVPAPNMVVEHIEFITLQDGSRDFAESLKIGTGGFGSVYLCSLPPPLGKVAVKKLHNEGQNDPSNLGLQFRNEIFTVSSFSHKNLLPLLGYSCDGPSLCLVYELMASGSLEDRLQCKGSTPILSWSQRLAIVIGSAKGLLHLHTSQEKPMVHRDVKSANILLNHNMEPKVGDFGLARIGSSAEENRTIIMTSVIQGTTAYMAPEAFRGDISVKMDVFSFGVVLLEVITGLLPFDEEREGCDLKSYVDEVEDIEKLIDIKPETESQIPRQLFKISEDCTVEKKIRPHMAKVLELLELL